MSELFFRITLSGLIKQRYRCVNCQERETAPSINHFLKVKDYDRMTDVMQHNALDATYDSVMINDTEHFVYIHQIGVHYLWYASSNLTKDAKTTAINLIKVFATQYMTPNQHDDEKRNFLFDSIQKLNNDVINKQRETVKLNQKLSHLNNILNNRLVKDPLTKLVSRYQYRDEITMLINKHPEAYSLFWFIDIDDFKHVNDTYGHQFGDAFLIEVANRLTQLPFKDAIKMRIAGDEFGLYVPNCEHIDERTIESFYKTFSEKVIKPITIDNHTVPFTCSIGIAIYNKHTTDINQLIDYADFAMYQAKQSGKEQYALFNQKAYDNNLEMKYK